MATPTSERTDRQVEIETLLQQWKALMAASRPRWSTADLTITQLRALSAVARREGMRVSELGDELGVGLAAASALADRMTKRKFIERRQDPDDRRIVRLEVTTRGRALIERLERGRADHFGGLITRMTPAEREALATTLRAFVRLSGENVITKEAHGIVAFRRAERC